MADGERRTEEDDEVYRHNCPHPTHISAPQQKKTYNILANKKVAYGATPER